MKLANEDMKGQAFVEADFYESRKNIYHLAATNI
jgi:hypothetical protein